MYHGSKLPAEIRSLAHRIDGLTKAMLMDMVTRDNLGPNAREICHKEIAKITARETQP
jgi:hypothetical protein